MKDDSPREKKGFFSVFKKSKQKKSDEEVTEEIKDIVQESHEAGVIAENTVEMINNIIDLGEKTVSDVMTHRKNVVFMDAEATLEETFEKTMQDGFSRYPVYVDNIDNIVGIYHIRDLVKCYFKPENRGKTLLQLSEELLMEVSAVPETRLISKLFKEMQHKKSHMVLVVDEYGETAGIVTMEDVLEEIVGNIWDEHDEPDTGIDKQKDGSYLLYGHTELSEAGDALDIEFSNENIETVNGFMTYNLGHIPQEGEKFSFEFKGYLFEIISVKNRVVEEVKATKLYDYSED